MKIGILTLPLHTNYGGILQAYAMQKFFQKRGHEVEIIDSRKRLNALEKTSDFIRKVVYRYVYGRKSVLIFGNKDKEAEEKHISKNTDKFISTYLRRSKFHLGDMPKNQYNAVIVGSDQIWRPKYYRNILDAYLAFTKDWNTKRISYAPSFGTDVWEYNEKQTSSCRNLLKRFDAISVRESSGLKLVKEKFGMDATHVLDPTMLLEKEDYIHLFEEAAIEKRQGELMVYVLDDTNDKRSLAESISQHFGFKIFATGSRYEDINASILERIHPPLEEWLRGFYDASFVITDSFHACVFSILFNKPFIVYGNKNRGVARFKSLLQMFNLEQQYVESPSDILSFEKYADIDWSNVNSILKRQRDFSDKFLNNLL